MLKYNRSSRRDAQAISKSRPSYLNELNSHLNLTLLLAALILLAVLLSGCSLGLVDLSSQAKDTSPSQAADGVKPALAATANPKANSQPSSSSESAPTPSAEPSPAKASAPSQTDAVATGASATAKTIGEPRAEEAGDKAWQQLVLNAEGKIVYQELELNDLDAWLKVQEKPVFLDFWATWCGPCRFTGPIVVDIAKAQADKIIVLKGNIDYLPLDLLTAKNVMGVPYFLYYEKGELKNEWLGADRNLSDDVQKLVAESSN